MRWLVLHGVGLLLWLASLWLVVPLFAQAQSLGVEQVLSKLGDPVEIEIQVDNWQDVDLERLQIVNATAEQYQAFHLSYLSILNKLNFNLIGPNSTDEVKVLVSSREPMSEPIMELLLVLRWPQGSSLREYVMLFDPPASKVTLPPPSTTEPSVTVTEPSPTTEPSAAVVEPKPSVAKVEVKPRPTPSVTVVEAKGVPNPVPNPVPKPRVVETESIAIPTVKTQPAIEVESVAPSPAVAPPQVNDTRRRYQVRSGDTLWVVAKQFQPAGVGENLYQILISLHELNRNAFINGNISLLKANAVLRIPMANEIAAINPGSAQSLFEERWQEGIRRSEAASKGEPVPAFSPIYEPASNAIAELAKKAEMELSVDGEIASAKKADKPNGLLSPVATIQASVPVQSQPAAPAPGSAAQVKLEPPTVEPTLNAAITSVRTLPQPNVSEPAAADTNNPYLAEITATANKVQTLLTTREQRLMAVEQQITKLKQQLQEAQQTVPNPESTAPLQEEDQQALWLWLWLYAGIASLLLGALIITVRLALWLHADIRKLGV